MLIKLVITLLVFTAINAQLLPQSGWRRVRPGPIVQTKNGPVQGQEETYDIFRRIHTFKGIRYGQAPVGNLRFRQALPAQNWQQVHRAWEYGPRCAQITLLGSMVGEEDCLFLNIAAPTNIRAPLPVGVLIHGGGLQLGSGQMNLLGPEYINQENIIFVSLNYRLNVFGFLNTGDANSPGNYGIKDMILALQWVRDNIASFGGNPNDVTIIGPSGGAVGVHSLIVSPVSARLFNKALVTSGSLFNNWAFNRDPRANAVRLAQRLQLNFDTTQDMVAQFRQVSVERLLAAAGGLTFDFPVAQFDELDWMPSLDPVGSTEPRIFPAPVEILVRTGNINRVPILVGFNSVESLSLIASIRDDPTILERFNQNPHLLVPQPWNLAPNSPEAQEVIAAFRDIYFGGAQNLTQNMAQQFADYASDREYIFGISKLARLHRAHQPVYYYRFSYSGALSFGQRGFFLSQYPGAMHGDDTFYLYRLNIAVTPILPSNEAFDVQRRVVRLWTNFLRFGNPTPSALDPMLRVNWPLMTTNEEFLDINGTLTAGVHPFRQRMDVWHAFDGRFGQFASIF